MGLTQGLDAERQGGDVQQQDVLHVAAQDAALDRGTLGVGARVEIKSQVLKY
jgi:hypothetical protein